MSQPLTSFRSSALNGRVQVPGDKSISHRSLIFGALAIGQTHISGLLEAEDVIATANALQQLGADIHKDQATHTWTVTGCGVGGLMHSNNENKPVKLDFGNSGTGSRLMMGVVAGHNMTARFTGDESLNKRPMGRVLTPLKQMGLDVLENEKDTFPLTLKGTDNLIPIQYELPVASAQVKSAILLAALMTEGETSIVENVLTRDHTERMLSHFGAILKTVPSGQGQVITLHGPAKLKGQTIQVPADPSSAAFLTAAALLCPNSDITIEGVLTNPTRFGFYQTLLEMGADITLENKQNVGGETIADLRVKTSHLKGVTVPPERAPTMIDEYPCLAVLSAFAKGETHMRGLSELRVKECDRLNVTAAGLQACGIQHSINGDDLSVFGQEKVRGGALVKTELDHRIAMSFLILGLASERPVTVDDISMIATSFPEFPDLLLQLGAQLKANS